MNNLANKVFPILVVLAVVFQVFYWNNTSEIFFEELEKINAKDVDYVAVYSSSSNFENLSTNRANIIRDKKKIQELLSCIQGSEEISKIGLNNYFEKMYFSINSNDKKAFDFELVISKKLEGYLGLFYRYRDSETGERFIASGKKLKGTCLYQWFKN